MSKLEYTKEFWAIGKTHIVLNGGDAPKNNTWIKDIVPLSLGNYERAKQCVNAASKMNDPHQSISMCEALCDFIITNLKSDCDSDISLRVHTLATHVKRMLNE